MRKLLLLIVVALLAFFAFEWLTFPDVAALAKEHPQTTAFMELRRRQLRAAGKDDAIDYRWVRYERVSPYLRRAVLVAEDDAFYEHEGVDVEAMKEALRRDWERRKITHGGSTITQQLAKNLYLSPSRNPYRKIKEYFIARALEDHLSKKRILEIYLNVVEMGERVYGAEAAARHYFGKPASALTPQEAALLAGCLPNPRRMSPGAPNKRLRGRQRMILSRMRRWGHLAEDEVLTQRKPVKSDGLREAPAPPPAQAAEPTAPETTEPPSTETEPSTTDTTVTAEPPPPPDPLPPSATSSPPALD